MMLIALLLVATVVAEDVPIENGDPDNLVDWDSCSWRYFGNGDYGGCLNDEVAIGACATRDLAQCSGKTHGVQCCKLNSGSTNYQCEAQKSAAGGDNLECLNDKAVKESCGSLITGSCYPSARATGLECCSLSGIRVSTSCSWIYSNGNNQGENITCTNNRVLAGRCGCKNQACCNGNTHAIKCCSISRI